MKRVLFLAVALFALGYAELAHAVEPPSLSVDTAFAPPTGVVEDDLSDSSDTLTDIAAFGGTIYSVGGTVDTGGDAGMLVMARRTNGTWDTGFSGDGKLTLQIAPTSQQDLATAVAVLPDGRLRVAGEADVDATSATNRDVVLLGLLQDGSYDPSFGGGDGVEIFPVGASDDSPTAIALDPNGRIAVTGYTTVNNLRDTFVSLRNADGSPVSGFGSNGVVTLARADADREDYGDDISFRPGGGLVALIHMDVDPDANSKKTISVLHGYHDDGTDDHAFGTGGAEAVVDVGGTNTLANHMLYNRGRLWLTGKSEYGVDQDAFVARTDVDGRGLESRHFDFRGKAGGTDAVVSNALDLTVLAGPPESLVVVGSVGAADSSKWGAAAFNGLEGDLATAGYGDVLTSSRGIGALTAAAADSAGGLGAGGTVYDTSSILNTRIGGTRLLLDADKTCDLALEIPTPLELTFVGRRSTAASISVTNKGTRPCGGTVSLAAPYTLGRAIATGVLGPGEKMTTGPVPVTASVLKRADDVARFSVDVAGDDDTSNNLRGVRVVFAFCDLGLSAVEHPATVPSEGFRRAEVALRNTGTIACRKVGMKVSGGVGGGASKPYAIERGRSVSDDVELGAKKGAKVGKKVTLRVSSTSADEDPFTANDTIRLTARVVGVGDSNVRSLSSRSVTGSASGGHGVKADAKGVRLTRVEVAIRRLGKGCQWLSGSRFVSRKGTCSPSGWKAASGSRSWRLSLKSALPAGRYEVYSRAVTANGFREGRFATSDRNRVTFRLG